MWFKKLPLRIIFTVPLVLLLLLTSGLIGVLASNNSQTVVNDLASQLRKETTARVEQNLQDYVSIGTRIDRINADLFLQGLLNVSDTKTATHYFFQQASQFPGVSTIEFADAQGNLIGGNRAENYIVIANDSTNHAIRRYAADANGYATDKVIREVANYDARTRGWYKSAVNAGGAIWTDISPSPLGARLDESAVLPVYDQNHTLQGVFSVDVSLSTISDFLKGLKVGQTGQVFIIERNGDVVASSFNEVPYLVNKNDPNQLDRLMAVNSQQPLISQTAKYISPNLSQFNDAQQIDFNINNERQFVQVTPFQQNGLNWLIMVVVPEKDFMTQIEQHNQTTLLLILVGLAIATLFGILLADWVTRPIRSLNIAAKKLAAGQWDQVVKTTREDEVGQLAQSFNHMAQQLQEVFGTLENRIADRTRDLQIAANVSRQITTVLDTQELLQQVVTITAKNFNFYASNIFLFDKDHQTLKYVAGANANGQVLTSSINVEMSLDVKPSLVTLAARTQKPSKVDDVKQSADYLPVESLPNTRSELCIPMLLGDRLLGVFDLQAETPNYFNEETVRVLTSLAEQVTIAVRNAQLFVEAQAARVEAERANTVKSQFLAAMSHELRTPLNAIINFSKFIRRELMGPVTPQQSSALEKVLGSADHLLNLINDVLDISKIEAGALQLYVEPDVNLRQELESVKAAGQVLLEGKPIELRLETDDQLPLLTGDKQRIRQIMLNLVSNACKFTEKGHISIKAHQSEDKILLAVEDSGPGIDPGQYDAIFETFRQAETGLKHGKGTGLGLPISRRLAEAHGGRLWLESKVNEGSTFYVTLPVKPSHLQLTV